MSRQSSVQPLTPFEMVVDTTIAGASGVGNFQLLIDSADTYRYKVTWGDGTTSASTTTTDITHTYPSGGTYTIQIEGRFDKFDYNYSTEAYKIISINSWGNIKWKSFRDSFERALNLTAMTTTSPIVEKVTDLNSAFRWCQILDADFSNWDVGKVTDMGSMFSVSQAFTNGGSPNISGWTTSNVTTMYDMFSYTNAFNQDISVWDTSNVVNMAFMFTSSGFNNGGSPNISGWTTSACTDMRWMFYGNSSFNQPIGTWDTSNVLDMNNMFYHSTTNTFNQDIGAWDVSNVTLMDDMFYGGISNAFNNGGSPSISGWTTSACTDMNNMFRRSVFNQPIGSWDVSNVSNMVGMFFDNTVFDQNLGSWDVGSVESFNTTFRDAIAFNNGGSPSISGWTITSATTAMDSMFYNCTAFNQDISAWDVSNVQDLGNIFGGNNPGKAFNQDLSVWDVSSANDLRSMFSYCTSFNNGGNSAISGWTTSACTNMQSMFSFTAFNQPIGSWDVSNVTLFRGMFRDASSFNQDIGSWDISNIASNGMTTMFQNATNFNNGGSPSISGWTTSASTGLNSLFVNTSFDQDISAWDVSNVTNMELLFSNCPFNHDISSWDVSNVAYPWWMFRYNSSFNQDIGSWDVGSFVDSREMFLDATAFDQDLGDWNVSGVTNMSQMFNNTNLSVDNYNSILTGWTGWDGTGATKTLQSNVVFGASGLNYSSGTTADDARNYLLTGLSWTITDAGGV